MADQVFPITFKPGILRDGSPFQGEYCTNGQWTRFFKGFPQNIGGMTALKTTVPLEKAQATCIYVDQEAENPPNIFIGLSTRCQTEGQYFVLTLFNSQNGTWTPPPPNNTILGANWQIIPIIFQNGQVAKKSILCVPRMIASITSKTPCPEIWNYCDNSWVKVTTLSDNPTNYTKLLAELTGGVLFVNPYLFVYGNNGLVRWSKSKGQLAFTAAQPFKFDLLKYSINISTDKVICAAGIRGGTANPSVLFWTLSSVIRLTNQGTINSNDGDDISFKKEIITNDSSILSSNCVVEYDGIFYWPGTGRFFTYNGVVLPLENNLNRQTFFATLDMKKRQLVFGVKNIVKDEIWWFYPEKGKPEDVGCTRVVIYNVIDNNWYDTAIKRDCGYFDNVSGNMYTVGKNLVPYDGDQKNYIWQHETGTDQINNNYPSDNPLIPTIKAIPSYFTTPIISYASFNNFKQASGIDRWMQIKRIEPNFAFTADAKMTITFNSQVYPLSPVISSEPLPINTNNPDLPARIEFMFQGRNINFTFKSEGLGSGYQMSQTFVMADVGDGR
jgi:hypothetical protein